MNEHLTDVGREVDHLKEPAAQAAADVKEAATDAAKQVASSSSAAAHEIADQANSAAQTVKHQGSGSEGMGMDGIVSRRPNRGVNRR